MRCAIYHFNTTLRHFEYALGNYVAYEPGSPSNTQSNISEWKSTEYKELICVAEELTYQTYNLYKSLNQNVSYDDKCTCIAINICTLPIYVLQMREREI